MSDFKVRMHQIDFGWGSAQNPPGELTALPQPSSWNKGALLLREREGKGKERRMRGKRGEGRRGEGREREGAGNEKTKKGEGREGRKGEE